MKIAVIGAGIGGLTFALAAHRLGLKVRLFESVTALRPLGVGINLQPNAVRELTELGLGADLAAMTVPTAELRYFSRHGQLIWSEPRGIAAGYKWPQYSVHRGRLQMLLLSAVRERLGNDAVRTGCHLMDLDVDELPLRARFRAQGATQGTPTETADVLIGADGIHSAVRRVLHPDESPPIYGPWVMYRGAVPATPFLDGRTMISAGTRDQRVVAYPMTAPTQGSPQQLINWVASLPRDSASALPPEQWNQRVEKDALLQAFEQWRFPWLDIPALIDSTAEVFQFPFVDRDPVPFWTRGRVTLIGDAAHPMYPIGSQAGSQAIVDASVLASALARFDEPEVALREYEELRRPAMNDLAVRNRGLGAETVMQIVEERAPEGFSRLEDVISRRELEDAAAGFKRLAGIDVDTVNSRGAWFSGS